MYYKLVKFKIGGFVYNFKYRLIDATLEHLLITHNNYT